MADFFKFLLSVLEKLLKFDCRFFFLREVISHFFPVLQEQFYVRKEVLYSQIFKQL